MYMLVHSYEYRFIKRRKRLYLLKVPKRGTLDSINSCKIRLKFIDRVQSWSIFFSHFILKMAKPTSVQALQGKMLYFKSVSAEEY